MESIGLLFVVMGAMLHAVVQIRSDPTIDRRFVGRTLAAAGVFLLYVGGGVLAFVGLLGAGSSTAPGAGEAAGALVLLFLLGWIAWGIVLLIRMVPRRKEPPAWLMRVGWVDATLLLAILGAAAGLVLRV